MAKNFKTAFGMEVKEHKCAACSKHYGTMAETMREFKHGDLRSGSKTGPKVTSRKQAIAIGINQAKHHAKAGLAKKLTSSHKPTVAAGGLAGAALGAALVGGMAAGDGPKPPGKPLSKSISTPHVPITPKAGHESGKPMLTTDALKPSGPKIESGPQKHHAEPKRSSSAKVPSHETYKSGAVKRRDGESFKDYQSRLKDINKKSGGTPSDKMAISNKGKK
ncbi:hypothetical protein AYO40_01120 [Planctomycetaceae bacterium SCGC AG-212-D15]|nr:hypothetical protein AYO40_01120 [Planctomycetaceae bacterium SCGC AG-212-D15]